MRIAVVKFFFSLLLPVSHTAPSAFAQTPTNTCNSAVSVLRHISLDIALYLIKCRKESKSAVLNLKVILCLNAGLRHSVSV